jgi:hypothetical protein
MNAAASHNVKFLSHSDQGGRGDGVQVMVNRGFAYVGHGFSNGITIIDVRDAKNPETVNFLPCPPNTRAHHLQTHDDLLLAVNGPSVWTMQVSQEAYFAGNSGDALKNQQFTSGLRIFDLAKPEAPREIAFLPLGGLGPHRIWYVGERYAYVSVHLPEFTDHILVIVDMKEPTRPEVVGKFWLPGMNKAAGETPAWPQGKRYALHHGLAAGNLFFSAWRDGGLAIVDVADPAKPKLVSHRNWDPPFGGGTHSPLPLPDRNLLVVADEAKADYCKKGGNFGPHNLWENRPGAFQSSRYIFATLHNAGVRVYDIENPSAPVEAGYFVPPPPARMFDPRPNRPQVIQSCDCYVDAQGVMYLTDSNAGLYILQFDGA